KTRQNNTWYFKTVSDLNELASASELAARNYSTCDARQETTSEECCQPTTLNSSMEDQELRIDEASTSVSEEHAHQDLNELATDSESAARNNSTCDARQETTSEEYCQPTTLNSSMEVQELRIDEASTSASEEHAHQDAWKSTIKKAKRDSGQEYLGRKYNKEGGFEIVTKPAKEMGKRCDCKKKTLVCWKVTDEDRLKMFQYVWGLSNKEKKVFVRGMVERDVPKEGKLGESRRSLTMKYYLEVNKGSKLRVCKSFFLSTTGLCNWWLHNALTEEIEQTKEATRNRVEPQEGSKRLQQWLTDLPKLPSHYSRQSSKKLYLEPTFQSYLELYRRYVVDMEELGQKAMSRFKFMEEFHAMGLSLFHPRKDRCDICVGFEEKSVEEVVYNAHRVKADRAQKEKADDKLKVAKNGQVKLLTMDLQSVLLCPRTNASALYYKTKLCIHNFTIYDLITKDCVCYVWNETDGSLTANEFATCVVDYLSQDLTPAEYILYSDGCGYQNRNVTMSSALSYFAIENGKTVTQKILEKGHTMMEVDSAHATIERHLKNRPIHCPADYKRIIEESRRFPRPYVVKYLEYSFFKDFSKVNTLKTIRPGRGKGERVVTDLRAIQYSSDGQIRYKLEYNDDWSILPLGRKSQLLLKVIQASCIRQGGRSQL
ncbi:hypothetical protein PoB_006945500, partial [Plakobranchus ocellatus]